MWTFDNPPLKLLKEKYNFVPTQAWLDHLRLSSVRLIDGGSGSSVSVNCGRGNSGSVPSPNRTPVAGRSRQVLW
ncbi:MAG: hypothetical protein WBE76_08440 [Terracidiphilus sp.]